MINSEILCKTVEYKNLFNFDYNSCTHFLQSFFVDLQFKKSNLAKSSVKYANEETIEDSKKRIKMLKIKEEIKNNHQEIFHSIVDLEAYYMNWSELAADFLEEC